MGTVSGRHSKFRWGVRAISSFALCSVMFIPGLAQADARRTVREVSLQGVVDPFEATYVSSAIEQANTDGVEALLLRIDTPGGLDSSMRKIIKSILASRVPVICYVGPSGARAASAGTFILMACPIAAMAPSTNVGAAHPVGVSGALEQTKVTNDAVAFIRGLAEQHRRDPDWAEAAVRRSVSISAKEALDRGVIDLISADRRDLLARLDGREVSVGGGKTQQLRTRGIAVSELPRGLGTSFLHGLFTPNFAFIFFYAGIILIVLELLHPGISVPGVVGVLLLATSLASFGMLPVQLLGVSLLVGSALFFLIELKHPGFGVSTVGGTTSLVLGGLLLFDPAVPSARVSLFVIVPMALATTAFFVVVVSAAIRTRRLPPASGLARAIGEEGIVTATLAPQGVIQVASERWTALSDGRVIPVGAKVRVLSAEGLRLHVEPLSAAAQSAAVDVEVSKGDR